ncbi:hypothetical protein BDZ89DRAFT_949390 [Hymenopellis radicata]|nr:hypothetical protein BDZ89DRAFT_949390 [Hymenopellis radicata]
MNVENRSGDSIWSLLSNIKHDDTEPGPSGDGGHDTDSTHSGGSHTFSDNSSIMMYSPLIPMKDDLVEIADSEVVAAPSTTSLQLPINHAMQLPPQAFKWPWSKKQGTAAAPASGDDKKDGETKPGDAPTPTPTLPPIEHRVWIPSTTKLSCEIMWWGYRLYLPPPILAILSDKQLEATKRAAMITTALTWLFSNLPVSAFPLPMQPAILLFQKLVPYVGYIGTFISWSWSTVKSYDVGYGVILSATWLLPVALLPGTWREADWPGDKKTPATGTAPSVPSSPTPGPSAPVPTVTVPTITPGTSDDQGAPSATPSKGHRARHLRRLTGRHQAPRPRR